MHLLWLFVDCSVAMADAFKMHLFTFWVELREKLKDALLIMNAADSEQSRDCAVPDAGDVADQLPAA